MDMHQQKSHLGISTTTNSNRIRVGNRVFDNSMCARAPRKNKHPCMDVYLWACLPACLHACVHVCMQQTFARVSAHV